MSIPEQTTAAALLSLIAELVDVSERIETVSTPADAAELYQRSVALEGRAIELQATARLESMQFNRKVREHGKLPFDAEQRT